MFVTWFLVLPCFYAPPRLLYRPHTALHPCLPLPLPVVCSYKCCIMWGSLYNLVANLCPDLLLLKTHHLDTPVFLGESNIFLSNLVCVLLFPNFLIDCVVFRVRLY